MLSSGVLQHAFDLIASPGFSGNSITYAFNKTTSDLSAAYSGLHVPYPSGGSGPLYVDVLSPLITAEEAHFSTVLSGLQNLLAVSLSQSNTPAAADISIGAINYAYFQVGGWAYDPAQGSLAGDVWILNPARMGSGVQFQFSYGTTGDYFYVAAPHELGHALGLKHTTEAGFNATEDTQKYSIMSYNVEPQHVAPAYTYQIYDIASLQYLYGRNDNYNSGDTSYDNFTTTLPTGTGTYDSQISIWDGGGTDTIDTSAYAKSAFVDLRPGHFSTIGAHSEAEVTAGQIANTGQENISIAFGADIENAVGGTLADGILGNAA
jgi:hypothetical protein